MASSTDQVFALYVAVIDDWQLYVRHLGNGVFTVDGTSGLALEIESSRSLMEFLRLVVDNYSASIQLVTLPSGAARNGFEAMEESDFTNIVRYGPRILERDTLERCVRVLRDCSFRSLR
jgi:hypothetical protein